MYAYPESVIMVFCKAPIPGQVKTRLMPALSAQEAAELHCELTELTLKTVTQNSLCEIQLWCSPTVDHPFFFDVSERYLIERQLQQGKNLGARMHHAFVKALTHYQRAIIIGCDCPSLTVHDLQAALNGLRQPSSCVVAPAEDGGYVLIGLNVTEAELFTDISWGTPQVFSQTHARITAKNLHYDELPQHWDVDTHDDLKRYRNNVSAVSS